MSLYQPSSLRLYLDDLGVSAKKSLSQNFLIDGNIIRKIIEHAHVEKGDVVIEIGPGPGALTDALIDAGAHLIAIEKDAIFSSALIKRHPTAEIFADDFMNFPLESFLKKRLMAHQKAKVVANLPYHLTTPIITKLVPLNPFLSSLTLMVQKEVADRFIAKKNSSQYSSISLFLQYYTNPRLCFSIEPSCFYPKPTVRSAVVHFDLKNPPPSFPEEKFFQVTRKSFQKRRKMLRASLKDLYGAQTIEKNLETLELDPLSRPENLSLEEFMEFFWLCEKK